MNDLLITKEGNLLSLRFNRPSKRNALTSAMYQAATSAINLAQSDDTLVIVLSGEDYFCGGNDLPDFMRLSATMNPHSPNLADILPAGQFLQALQGCTKPIIAAVEKGAVGIGATMLLHCDFVFCGKSTQFTLPFAKLGVTPEGGASRLLTQRAGYLQAMKVLMLGETFNAQMAKELGLVSTLVDDGQALSHAQQCAERLLSLPSATMLATKAILRQESMATDAIAQTIRREINLFIEHLMSPATQAMVRAQFQKISSSA